MCLHLRQGHTHCTLDYLTHHHGFCNFRFQISVCFVGGRIDGFYVTRVKSGTLSTSPRLDMIRHWVVIVVGRKWRNRGFTTPRTKQSLNTGRVVITCKNDIRTKSDGERVTHKRVQLAFKTDRKSSGRLDRTVSSCPCRCNRIWGLTGSASSAIAALSFSRSRSTISTTSTSRFPWSQLVISYWKKNSDIVIFARWKGY